MAKNIANEQALLWLRGMANDRSDVFNSINAENCLMLIEKQRKALVSLGAHFCNLKKQRDRYARIIDEARRIVDDD